MVDERDIITLRAVLRDNNVYLLPAAKDVSKELFRQVFIEMLEVSSRRSLNDTCHRALINVRLMR